MILITEVLSWFPHLPPGISRHVLDTVIGHQLLQYLRDRDKLALVITNFRPEQQAGQVHHVLFGALVVAPQILRELLQRQSYISSHAHRRLCVCRVKLWAACDIMGATGTGNPT